VQLPLLGILSLITYHCFTKRFVKKRQFVINQDFYICSKVVVKRM